MIFNSWVFVVFFVCVYLGYLRLHHRAQNWLLLVASYVFFSYWDYRFLSLVIISTLVDFFVGREIARSASAPRRRLLLVVSLVVNLGILACFKYFDFFIENAVMLMQALGLRPHIETLGLILPMGISFYTFQTLSYTIDVYRGRLQPCHNLRDFALFVAFFPQLVAGPIERATRLLIQVVKPRVITLRHIGSGLFLLAEGYFLKVVVADNAAAIVDEVFAEGQPSGTSCVIAVYAFALQIYCDFAGYSRIARGLARLMGFRLVVNFRQPYLATNPSDFWQRWHISLSTWLRDYLYIPLGGNRRGRVRTYLNLMTTMLLGGLWHGAAWNFVLWGMYHGGLLVLFRLWPSRRRGEARPHTWSFPLRAALWFQLTCIGWMLFRCQDLSQVVTFARAILAGFSLDHPDLATLILLAAPVVVLDFYNEYRPKLAGWAGTMAPARQSLLLRGAALTRLILAAVMLALIFLCGARGGEEFIYFQF